MTTPRERAVAWAAEVAADPSTVVLDTETTGLGPDAEIVDIAVVDMSGRVLLDQLVMPLNDIPAEASAVHGITVGMLDRARAPMFAEIYPRIVQTLFDRLVTVYNADYDLTVINGVCRAHKLPVFAEEWFCAMRAFSHFAGERNRFGTFRWFKLGEAAARLGISAPNAHRALADCLTTVAVVKAMAEARPLDVEDASRPDGACEGCGGQWLMGRHFHPREIEDALLAADMIAEMEAAADDPPLVQASLDGAVRP